MQKVIVISGGSDGLGKAIAQTLSHKHKVIILSPSKTKLAAAAQELNCEFEVCDVTNHQQTQNTIANIVTRHGIIDCLINNAALWIQGELVNNDPQRIKEVVEVNILGVMYLTQSVIPYMKTAGKGLIINISSQAGLYGKPERSIYNSTKWAVTGFTKCLQPELSRYGIVVSGIYPGLLNTKMFEKLGIEKDMNVALETQEVAKVVDFLLTFDNNVVFPEIGIKNLKN